MFSEINYNKIQIFVIKIFEMHTPHNKIQIYVIKIFEMTPPLYIIYIYIYNMAYLINIM